MNAERKQFFMNPLSPSIPKQLGKMEDNFVDQLKKREAEWERKWNLPFPKKELANTPSGELTMEKQSKKAPVEAQKIWKELIHEERLNKRLGKGRELISVLSQVLGRKTSPAAVEGYAMRAEEAAKRAQTSANEAKDSANSARESATQAETAETNTKASETKAEDAATRAETAKDKANTYLQATATAVADEKKRQGSLKERVKKYGLGAVGTVLGIAAIIIALNAGDGKTDQAIATPTPSAAAGTPTPTPTQEPTETPAPEPTPVLTSTPKPPETPSSTEMPEPTPTLFPKSAEVEKIPNFGITVDSDFKNCQVIDRNTNNVVNVSNYPFKTIGYQETQKGQAKTITSTAAPGQAIIIAGYAVDSETNGVLKVVVAQEEAVTVTNTIVDGFTRVVASKEAPIAFCSYLQLANRNGWAREHVSYPDAWKVNR